MKLFSVLIAVLSFVALTIAVAPTPGVDELVFFEGTYSATGDVVHYIPRIQLYFPTEYAEMHVDTPNKKAYIDQFFGQYWLFANDSYLIFPNAPGLCFKKPGYGLDTQNTNYGYAATFDTSNSPFKTYFGQVLDVGTCCDAVAIVIEKFQNKVTAYNFAQYYPSFVSIVNSTHVPYETVMGSNIFSSFGEVDQSKFDLPVECTTPETLLDYCTIWYQTYGWCDEANNLAVPYETQIPSYRGVDRSVEHFVQQKYNI